MYKTLRPYRALLLLDLGTNLNEVFRWNMSDSYNADIISSALHIAVRHDQEAMVEFLLRRGAKQDSLLDFDQATPRELAAARGNPAIMCLFDQYAYL